MAWGLLLAVWVAGCGQVIGPAATAPGAVTITIQADGSSKSYTDSPGLTVREAVAQAGITIGELDRLTPPPYTLISNGVTIVITRVSETFDVVQSPLPYTSQTVRNEALPAGDHRLLQVGQPGTEEITYRTVLENGIQVSRSEVRRVTITAPTPEIIMVGTQGSFTIVPISGTLAYIDARNAWVMRGNSGQRLPLTASSDLDGHVFDLSADGQWVLYTREVTNSDKIFNTLWAVSTAPTPALRAGAGVTPTGTNTQTNPVSVRLPISNVLYAEWSPVEPRQLAYSTAERISRAPGWQANNDLWLMSFGPRAGTRQYVFTPTLLLDASSGGLYGWWGTGYAFAPDGKSLAYARTDSIGLINFSLNPRKPATATVTTSELLPISAFNTHSDWAWYPTMRWSPDGHGLYTITHAPPIGLEAAEDSPAFDVTALLVPAGKSLSLIPRAGMFANPMPAPVHVNIAGELAFQVAFLQATNPNDSPHTTYRLGVMDRDGSNVQFVFPPGDQPGLSANSQVAWSPDGRLLVVAYNGNLWLVDPNTSQTQQVTGDGLTTTARWER
jgi:resuscitation-promoting factor RpfB